MSMLCQVLMHEMAVFILSSYRWLTVHPNHLSSTENPDSELFLR